MGNAPKIKKKKKQQAKIPTKKEVQQVDETQRALQVLRQREAQNVAACQAKVTAALQEHNCELRVGPMIVPRR